MAEQGRLALSIIVFNSVVYVVAAFGMFVLVFEDMTGELRETNRVLEGARDELRQLAITDPLTGVYNRRHLDDTFPRELPRHRRYTIPLSLMFVDVDRFKEVNDRHGHQVGDRVLRHVAGFLERYVREVDYVFRWGATGSSCSFRAVCRKRSARPTSSSRRSRRRSPRAICGTIGLSIGCTEVPPDAIDLDPLVRQADERMYRDKSASQGV